MSDNRWSANRRTFVKTAGAAGAVGLAGCNGGTSGETDDTPTAQFILNPAEADVEITQQYQPMFEYLESEVEVEIEADRAESYTATLQSMRNDQGEIADISPSAVLAGEDVVDIIGMRIAFGAAQYFSTIITTPDSGVESLTDIEGTQMYMGDILSVSGTLTPLAMLANAGLDIGNAPDGDAEDFDVEYSDHTTAREQMVQRDDVAAASCGAFSSAPYISQEQFDELSQDFVDISAEYDSAGDSIGDEHGELQLLAVSDPLPRAPLVSRSNWDDPVREEIEQALLDAPESAFEHDEDYDGEPLWFTGVEEATVDDYEPIRETMDTLGLEFEDLS
jgi:phosphonate transport system substrate-binding protein